MDNQIKKFADEEIYYHKSIINDYEQEIISLKAKIKEEKEEIRSIRKRIKTKCTLNQCCCYWKCCWYEGKTECGNCGKFKTKEQLDEQLNEQNEFVF